MSFGPTFCLKCGRGGPPDLFKHIFGDKFLCIDAKICAERVANTQKRESQFSGKNTDYTEKGRGHKGIKQIKKEQRTNLADALVELEKTNPEVAAAAEKLDQVTQEIVANGMTVDKDFLLEARKVSEEATESEPADEPEEVTSEQPAPVEPELGPEYCRACKKHFKEHTTSECPK